LREGEITFKERLSKCFTDLNNINRNKWVGLKELKRE
jgi:hypothetical protein